MLTSAPSTSARLICEVISTRCRPAATAGSRTPPIRSSTSRSAADPRPVRNSSPARCRTNRSAPGSPARSARRRPRNRSTATWGRTARWPPPPRSVRPAVRSVGSSRRRSTRLQQVFGNQVGPRPVRSSTAATRRCMLRRPRSAARHRSTSRIQVVREVHGSVRPIAVQPRTGRPGPTPAPARRRAVQHFGQIGNVAAVPQTASADSNSVVVSSSVLRWLRIRRPGRRSRRHGPGAISTRSAPPAADRRRPATPAASR